VEDNWPGVSLGLTYETRPLPTLAVQPFSSAPQAASQASQAENIIARDLQYSDRFSVLDALPAALVQDEVDYSLWDQIRVTWLVTGRLEGEGASATLVVELHDVVYREVAQRGRFPVPSADSPEFRLAAHLVSDAIVEWAFGEPGIAATRIAFSRRMDDGSQDLWVVDSDGENLRRLTRHQAAELGHSITMSPAWSPDGRRLAFVSYKDAGMPRIYELNLDTGAEKMIPTARAGDYITPTYHPGGELLYFGVNGGNLNGIYSYNVVRDCCLTSVIEGRSEDLSPSFSPDGARFAFNSNRLGVAAPQIYVGEPNGASRPELLSPYEYDRPGYYTSPDWAPIGDRIAYHGRVERRGEHQVLVAEVDARGRPMRHVRHTFEGVNEDPSWAPDGRHLVYVGVRSWGHALFITDVVTGNTRTIVSGIRPNNPAWSPPLAPR
jgi:TolB protein